MITILLVLAIFLALLITIIEQFLTIKELKTAIHVHLFDLDFISSTLPEAQKVDLKCSVNGLKKVL